MPLSVIRTTVFFFAVVISVAAWAADKPAVNSSRGQLAARGYDVVAYFTDGKPVVGSAAFEFRWSNAVWRFASAAHRDQFASDPARYAPQFGGYCAWAVSQGYTADGDPHVWRVVDGQLYLNYSTSVQSRWEQDVPGNIARGRVNWPSVLAK